MIWFITGASRGFGREWAIAALERGDTVAATARDTSTLDDLAEKYGDAILPLRLDVTDREAAFAAVEQAHDRFGRLDVVVNNAGYGQFGFVEELSEADARDQIETNVFGALWVTQAALPYLRAQGSGHIMQVSSIGGITAFPQRRHLPRVQVGAGGAEPGAGAGGGAVRHPRHADRAGRLLHRLGRLVGQARRAAARLRRLPRGGAADAARAQPEAGRPGRQRQAVLAGRRRRGAAAAGVLR